MKATTEERERFLESVSRWVATFEETHDRARRGKPWENDPTSRHYQVWNALWDCAHGLCFEVQSDDRYGRMNLEDSTRLAKWIAENCVSFAAAIAEVASQDAASRAMEGDATKIPLLRERMRVLVLTQIEAACRKDAPVMTRALFVRLQRDW